MESAAGSRGLGPYELPESLFYLTPLPPWFVRDLIQEVLRTELAAGRPIFEERGVTV